MADDLLDVRGDIEEQPDLIVTASPSDLVPPDHPIQKVKRVADEGLRRLGPKTGELYSDRGDGTGGIR